jgi:hypothetical protein
MGTKIGLLSASGHNLAIKLAMGPIKLVCPISLMAFTIKAESLS